MRLIEFMIVNSISGPQGGLQQSGLKIIESLPFAALFRSPSAASAAGKACRAQRISATRVAIRSSRSFAASIAPGTTSCISRSSWLRASPSKGRLSLGHLPAVAPVLGGWWCQDGEDLILQAIEEPRLGL